MLAIEDRFLVIVVALIVDALLGEPKSLWSRIPHPVALAGRAIEWLDREFNDDAEPETVRRRNGLLAIAGLVLAALVAGWLMAIVIDFLPLTAVLEALVVAVLVAGRSLYEHAAAVARGLAEEGIDGGREAIRHIVGRAPESLDEGGVCRAAIESTAENFSDGVVAPIFWYAILGLPGIFAYKAINTADSMIGHRTRRHEAFGMAAARVDDAINWIPARLSGALIALGASLVREDAQGARRAMREDAGRHRSVNAGWPEAAMAGALGLALAGPRQYGDVRVDDAWMNTRGRADAGIADIHRALRVFVMASMVHGALYAVLAVLF